MPVLCGRPEVVVLTDEAHRSQYDTPCSLSLFLGLPLFKTAAID